MPRAQLSTDELETMRQRLSDAALEIYRSEGLEAVTFRRLAEAMGLSHTLPYRYFENKDALLARMRTEGTRRFEAFVRAREPGAGSPLALIHSLAEAYIDFARTWQQDYLLIFSTHQLPPDRYPELLAARRSMFDHAVEIIQSGIDSGDIEGNPRELAHTFWINLHGLMTLHVANQLVHGMSLEQLAPPLIERILGSTAAGRAKTKARAKPDSAGARSKPAQTSSSGKRVQRASAPARISRRKSS